MDFFHTIDVFFFSKWQAMRFSPTTGCWCTERGITAKHEDLGCKKNCTSHGVMTVVQAYLRPLRPLLFDVICWLTPATMVISPVVTLLVGGLEHGFYDFPFILGMSSSQLTNSYFSEG